MILYIFIIGLFFGSFLNVLADRLPQGKSILGRSHCDYCKHVLGFKDLIPIISFILQKGKCRYCGKKLSYNYPLLELVTGLVFVLSFYLVNLKLLLSIAELNTLIQSNVVSLLLNISIEPYMVFQYIFAVIISSVLIVIFFADLRYGIIPDLLTLVGIIATSIWLMLFGQTEIINHLIAGVGAFLFFYLIFILTKQRGMGFGDVKFVFFMGLLLGVSGVIFALYIAFLTGGIVGIILILWRKKKMKSAIAFGPFLVIGTYISFFLYSLIVPNLLGLV